MSKSKLPEQYVGCYLYDLLFTVFSAKHKSKTALNLALAESLNQALSPYGPTFTGDKNSVSCGHTYVNAAKSQQTVFCNKGNVSIPEFAYHNDTYTNEEAASRLCARIASALEEFLFSSSSPFESLIRCSLGLPSLPALARARRERHLFMQDAAAKVYTLEAVLPCPNRVCGHATSAFERFGVVDHVDAERLASPEQRHNYHYGTEGFTRATISSIPSRHPGAFSVSDDLKTRWLSVSSWSERLAMLYVLEREHMQAYTASLNAVVTAMIPSTCPLEQINPPKEIDHLDRRDEQRRVQEFAAFVYHNGRPPVQTLEEYTLTVLDGSAKPVSSGWR